MHWRTASLFTALLGLVFLVTGFGALSPSFTLHSVVYAGNSASLFSSDSVVSDIGGVRGIDAAASVSDGVDVGGDAGVRAGLSGGHSSRPTVSIEKITPADEGEGGTTTSYGQEGKHVRVTLVLSRVLTEDEKYCYDNQGIKNGDDDKPCIEGGIYVWDTYDNFLWDEDGPYYDDGFLPVDQLIKFVFNNEKDPVYNDGKVRQTLSVEIPDDGCITPGRRVEVAINWSFSEEDYGYKIGPTRKKIHTIRVNGNDDDGDDGNADTTNGKMHDHKRIERDCKSIIDEGATEEFVVNAAPLFGTLPVTRSVSEDSERNQPIGQPVTATDPDEDPLYYWLGGADATSFSIDSSTGQLNTKAALDHETKPSYSLTVYVKDRKDFKGNAAPNEAEDDSIGVTINVDDVNEPPEFVNQPTTLNVVENRAGEQFGIIVAEDPDENDTLAYSLDTVDGAAFDINADGQISTRDALNREDESRRRVTVTATDSKGLTDTHVVTIDVTDENDPPTFEDENGQVQSRTTRSIAENTEQGQPVGAPVSATDDDSGDTLTYLLDDVEGASFTIDGNGQIKTKDPLNYEGKSSYGVPVSVHDGKNSNNNDDTTVDAGISVTIEVTDVEEAPEFTEGSTAAREVAESASLDDDIGAVVGATDDDGDNLTYTLVSADTLPFEIEGSSGQLKVKEALDHETRASYKVTVTVTDGYDSSGGDEITATEDDRITVTITVTDADDAVSLTLSSEHPGVDATLTATLTDEDTGVTNEVWVWEISPDGQDTWTAIPNATSSSYTPVSGDVDKFLRVTVTYEDTHNTGKELTEQADHAVRENADPVFADDSTTRSVRENTPAGRDIGAPVTATDSDVDDANIEEVLTYSLGGTDAAAFSIVADTGQLQTKAALDYERRSSYSVEVTATDRPGATDAIAVTINVTNVNEGGGGGNNGGGNNGGGSKTESDGDDELEVSFKQPSYSVDEGGTVTITVNVDPESDRDFEVPVTFGGTAESGDYSVSGLTNGKLSFDSGDTSASFTITTVDDSDRDDERITVEFGELPESVEGGTRKTVRINIEDTTPAPRSTRRRTRSIGGGGGGGINAAPDNSPPEFTEGGLTQRSVAENTGTANNIGNPVSATDLDGDTLIYNLGGDDVGNFRVDTSTGQLKTSSDLDFETDTIYYLVMTVFDGRGGRDSIQITVNVTDVAEQVVYEVVVESPVPTPVPVPVQLPDPTPEPTATPEPTPTQAPTPTPEPTPAQVSTATPWWTGLQWPTATAAPMGTPEPTPTPQTLLGSLVDTPSGQLQLSEDGLSTAKSQPSGMVPSVAPLPLDDRSLRIWPIVLIVLGATMEVVSIGMFVRGRTEEWIG